MLTITRWPDVGAEGFREGASRASALHGRRSAALHTSLDGEPALRVLDWGRTDDPEPQETIRIAVARTGEGGLSTLEAPLIAFLVETIMVDEGGDEAFSTTLACLVGKLWKGQDNEQIGEFEVRAGATAVRFEAPGADAEVQIAIREGEVNSVTYTLPRSHHQDATGQTEAFRVMSRRVGPLRLL